MNVDFWECWDLNYPFFPRYLVARLASAVATTLEPSCDTKVPRLGLGLGLWLRNGNWSGDSQGGSKGGKDN